MLLKVINTFNTSLLDHLKSPTGIKLLNDLISDLPQSLVLDAEDLARSISNEIETLIEHAPLRLDTPTVLEFTKQNFLDNVATRMIETLDASIQSNTDDNNDYATYKGTTGLVKAKEKNFALKILNSIFGTLFGKNLLNNTDDVSLTNSLLNLLGKGNLEVYEAAAALDPSINLNKFKATELPKLVEKVLIAYFSYDYKELGEIMTKSGQRMLIAASQGSLKKMRIFNQKVLMIRDINNVSMELIDNRPLIEYSGSIVMQIRGREGYFTQLGSNFIPKIVPFNIKIEWTKNGPKIAEFRASVLDPETKI